MTTQVYGVRETLAALKTVEPELRKQAMKQIRDAARPMKAAIEAKLPTAPPLSHMDNDGRLGWRNADRRVKIKVGGRKSRGRDEWPLVRLSLVSAPVALFDMAGRKSSNDLSAQLDRFGSASRAAWAVDQQLGREAEKAILEAIKEMNKAVNKDLVTKGAGSWQ
jgi:hypothetical protein